MSEDPILEAGAAALAGFIHEYHTYEAAARAVIDAVRPLLEAEWADERHAQLQALCRLLSDDGHMTPVGARQILAVFVRENP